MPTVFPTLDPETGELVDVTYWFAAEVAPRLHVSVRTLERRCQEGKWPHLKVVGTYYFSAAHVARIVDLLTVDPDRPGPPPRRLGVVVDDDDQEGLGGVR
jgi:hypothetical protein